MVLVSSGACFSARPEDHLHGGKMASLVLHSETTPHPHPHPPTQPPSCMTT